MTRKEIEKYRQRLAEIKTIAHSGDRSKAILELVRDTGASGCGRDMPSTGERDAINISSIHQALQTNISFEGMQNGVTGLYEG